MVNRKVEKLAYKSHRYDEKMYILLEEFKEDGVLEGLKKSDSLFTKNIYYLNEYRKKK